MFFKIFSLFLWAPFPFPGPMTLTAVPSSSSVPKSREGGPFTFSTREFQLSRDLSTRDLPAVRHSAETQPAGNNLFWPSPFIHGKILGRRGISELARPVCCRLWCSLYRRGCRSLQNYLQSTFSETLGKQIALLVDGTFPSWWKP